MGRRRFDWVAAGRGVGCSLGCSRALIGRYRYSVDKSTFLATLLGGGLAILGGVVATLLLAWLEKRRERQLRHQRHATAVRIVALELQGNGVAMVLRASGGTALTTTAGHDNVVVDLYGLMPDELATQVALAYTLTNRMESVGGAALMPVIERINAIRRALRAYGEQQLGVKFVPEPNVPTEPGAPQSPF